jgi:hypothetical protein
MRNSDIMEMVDELLDMEGDVVIGNLTFSRSYIVKRLDPIAYREICNDVVSSQIEDLQYDLDRLDPEVDADEIADIKERIEDLEGAF